MQLLQLCQLVDGQLWCDVHQVILPCPGLALHLRQSVLTKAKGVVRGVVWMGVEAPKGYEGQGRGIARRDCGCLTAGLLLLLQLLAVAAGRPGSECARAGGPGSSGERKGGALSPPGWLLCWATAAGVG